MSLLSLDQFNVSFLKKSINLFQKKKSLTDPKHLNIVYFKIS